MKYSILCQYRTDFKEKLIKLIQKSIKSKKINKKIKNINIYA